MSHSKCGCKRQNNCSLDLFNIIDAHNISKYSPTMSKSAKITAASLLFTFPLSSSSSYTVLSIRVFTPFLLYPWSFNITLFAYLLDSLLPFPSSSSTQFSLQSIGDFGTKELLLRFFCFCWSLDISLQMCLQCLHKTLWQSLYVNENCFKNFFLWTGRLRFLESFQPVSVLSPQKNCVSFLSLMFSLSPVAPFLPFSWFSSPLSMKLLLFLFPSLWSVFMFYVAINYIFPLPQISLQIFSSFAFLVCLAALFFYFFSLFSSALSIIFLLLCR